MKIKLNICLLALASTFSVSVLAATPYKHEYENGGHWAQAEEAKATVTQAEQKTTELDLSISMPPTAAGVAAFLNHPYLNGGNFGEAINGDRF